MKKNIIILLAVIALIIVPLTIHQNSDFTGADEQAEMLIGEINPSYKPWFASLWEPPGGEIESLLFALQAAIGAGFIGYYVGYLRGKKAKTR